MQNEWPPRCFLAHCAEMNLPLSLSTSAGRARIFISFLFPLLDSRCRAAAPPPHTHTLPWSCWSGGWEGGEIDGGREESKDGGEEEWRMEGGGGILQVATVSRSIEPLCCCTLPLPFTQQEEEELYLIFTRPCLPGYCCYASQALPTTCACLKPKLIRRSDFS